jgi:uncharacterized cofD-like protein
MKKIVTIGGGTGSYTVLSGLKQYPDLDITAVVSMADDGGSTGVLRDELGVLPPGDVRQCLVALSKHSDTVRKLMNYRFSEGGLSGHSFGNLFLAALEKVSGNFYEGVEIASDILKVEGKVVPITSDQAELVVTLNSGERILGENSINHASVEEFGVAHIGYTTSVKLHDHAKEAILSADLIVLGPGNYLCSLVPCLIVEGFKEVLQQTKAKLVFPVNLTNKNGHTTGWTVTDYVKYIEEYIERKIDVVIINNEEPSQEQVTFYKNQEGDKVLVVDDYQGSNACRVPILSSSIPVVEKSDTISATRSLIRHDGKKLAQAIITL